MKNMFYWIFRDIPGFRHEMFYTCFTLRHEMFYTSMDFDMITKNFGYVFNCNRI